MKALKIVLGLWIVVLALILIVSGCDKTEVAGDTSDSAETEMDTAAAEPDQQETVTEEVVEETPDLPVCGDAVCDETELDNCEEDCPSCDDSNKCTTDSFDLAELACMNKPIKDCCGDGICSPDEECEEDCPRKMIALSSYPYPFVHGDDLEADLVVGDGGTAKNVIAATAIATGLGISGAIPGVMESDITTIKDINVILIGNPCTNGFIAQLIPYENDCLEDYEEGEGRLSMFVTGKSGSSETYALVVSGYSDDDIIRAADILNEYERNMAMLKGTEIKV